MYRLLLLFGIFAAQSAWAQRFPSPPDNGLYRTDVVPRIDITIPADSLAAIFANVSSDYEYHAAFAFTAPGLRVNGPAD